MKVSSLHIYPVKGMRAVDVAQAAVEVRGLEHDRRWLVVNAGGRFITQRPHPKLATVIVRLTPRGIALATESHSEIEVETPKDDSRRNIVIWDSQVSAAEADINASRFLTGLLGENAHLVFMDEQARRLKSSAWTPSPVPVSFADGFPVLVTTTGSLAALNREIVSHGGETVSMTQFRPNIVVDCEDPWAEDRWTQLQIGDVILDLVKPSERCIVTTIDQQTGARMGKEPLASLARIRRSTDPRINGVIFGENAVPAVCGHIAVGDRVTVIKEHR